MRSQAVVRTFLVGPISREYATKRWVVWRYQERRECLSFMIDIQGGVVQTLPGIPVEYTIVVWTPDRIVADHETSLCGGERWLIDRLRNTAEYFSGACGDKTTATHFTLEDSILDEAQRTS